MQSGLLLCQWPSSCHIMSLKWPSSRNWVVFIWAIGRRLISRSGHHASFCVLSNVSNHTHVKYHSLARHTYPFTDAILFRSDARPPYWMKATAVVFISLPGVKFQFVIATKFEKRHNSCSGMKSLQKIHSQYVTMEQLWARWASECEPTTDIKINNMRSYDKNAHVDRVIRFCVFTKIWWRSTQFRLWCKYIAVHHNTMLNPAQQGKIFG